MKAAALEEISLDWFRAATFTPSVSILRFGRWFHDLDDQTAGAHPVAVASYHGGNGSFASGTPISDAKVTISSVVYSMVGVAPPGFFGMTVGQAPDLWIPLAMEKQISPGWNGLDQNLFQSLYIFARPQAWYQCCASRRQYQLLFKQILREYAGPQPSRKELEAIRNASIDLTPRLHGLSQLDSSFRRL